MMVDIYLDDENIVVWPVCQVTDCNQQVKHVSMGDITTAWPCGHVQNNPEALAWVVRDGEPDCGV